MPSVTSAVVVAGMAALLGAAATPALANGEVNIYSSRHYDTDEKLYAAFEEKTGVTVNRIEDNADVLIERMRNEGRNSPADILITVDVGRLARAVEADVLQPMDSAVIEEKVPAHLRDREGLWTGLSTRARIIFYDKEDVAEPPQSYEELADPKYEGLVCTRSSSNVYMLSLLASIIARDGEDAARAWAEGVWHNRAREPGGGDTDQLKALVSGECDIVLANHYYFARALEQDVAGLSEAIEKIGWIFPNQATSGTHVNVSGAGIARNAPNPDNARLFLEYLVSPQAQTYFASGNNEFPVVDGVAPSDAAAKLGEFTASHQPLGDFEGLSGDAQRIYDAAGYR